MQPQDHQESKSKVFHVTKNPHRCFQNQINELKRNGQINYGKWTRQEHRLFLENLIKHGRNWLEISKGIKNRSPQQCRSHSQKFTLKMQKLGLFLKFVNKHPSESVSINYAPSKLFDGDKFLKLYMKDDQFFADTEINNLKKGELLVLNSVESKKVLGKNLQSNH